ncbi:MAG: SbtA family thio(seleno)oxazole RiPP natural product precursor [Syntrophobacteraceae bacterium]
MDITDIKKVVAGLCVASLVSGAGIVTAASSQDAGRSGSGNLILAG